MRKTLALLMLILLIACCRTQTVVMSDPLKGGSDTMHVRRVIRGE